LCFIQGAWASSAPLHAQIDFFEYKEVMTNSIRLVGGNNCSQTIENAFSVAEQLVLAGTPERVELAFNLCNPLNLTTDVAHFFYEVSDIVAGLVQSHRTGSIESACSIMANEQESNSRDDLEAFAAWVTRSSGTCMDFGYANNIEKYRNSDWNAEANLQMRQWIYQTCSEFAWFQTSSSENQIFGTSTLYPVEYFIGLCQDLYDIR